MNALSKKIWQQAGVKKDHFERREAGSSECAIRNEELRGWERVTFHRTKVNLLLFSVLFTRSCIIQ